VRIAISIAVLVAAFGWMIIVLVLGRVLWKLGDNLVSTEKTIDGVTDRTLPLLSEVTTSVVHVNHELERVDAITSNVETITTNASSLVALFGATLGGPLVKVAAFSYGVRKAAGARNKAEVEKRVKQTMKDERQAAKAERKSARRKAT
jgi:predicted PurR-regulated permease PerM